MGFQSVVHMFKKLISFVRNFTSTDIVDPSQFDDPVAMQTEWTPAKKGGVNIRTHKLVQISSHRLEFQTSLGGKAFYCLFILIGIVLLIKASASGLSLELISSDVNTVLFLFMGLVFAILGGYMFISGTTPIVFDKHNGYFWKGRNMPGKVLNSNDSNNCVELGKIHSLQLISEDCSGRNMQFHSYELNIVLQNGCRINVVDHGSQMALRSDAHFLSKFLEKPVWDAI